MGLDMYLERVKREDGFTAKDYYRIDKLVSESQEQRNIWKDIFEIKVRYKSDTFTWYSIFDQVGYWRKANQIHRWFVENVQGGVDDCNPYPVSKDQLEDLRSVVTRVLEDNSLAPFLLPSQDGFFFGSLEYDDYYYEQLHYTLETLNKAFKETDFEREVIFYLASW